MTVAPFLGSLSVPQSPHLQGWTPDSVSEIHVGGGGLWRSPVVLALQPQARVCWRRYRIKKT